MPTKLVFFVIFTLLLASCGGGANVQPQGLSVSSKSIVGNNLIYTYSDGSSVSKSINASEAPVWGSDHITRTTTYRLVDGSSETIVESVSPTLNKAYNGSSQVVTTTYGDGYSTTVTNSAISNTVTWASDHITQTTTYTFADNETNSVVVIINPTSSTSYAGNTQTITTTYGDGFISTANNQAVSSSVSWAADHVTKTTTYTFSDATTDDVVETVAGTVQKTYATNVQTVTTTYGDGYVDSINNNADSNSEAWADDHITRTTTYTFSDGETNDVVSTVSPTLAYSYSGSTQTVTNTYGDGYVSTNDNAPSSTASTWDNTDNSVDLVHSYSNSEINNETREFSWSSYNDFNVGNSIELSGYAGYVAKGTNATEINAFGHSHSSERETGYANNPITVELTYSSGALVKAVTTHTDSTTDYGPSVATWDTASGASRTVYNEQFDLLTQSSVYSGGDEKILVASPTLTGFEYMTFGIWERNWTKTNNRHQETMASFSSGNSETPDVSLPASGSYTFNGYASATAYASETSLQGYYTSDLQVVVDFGAGTGTIAATNTIDQDGASRYWYDYLGNIAIDSDAKISGNVEFTKENVNSSRKYGHVVGSFYGPNGEELAGTIYRSSSSFDYRGSFGAAR